MSLQVQSVGLMDDLMGQPMCCTKNTMQGVRLRRVVAHHRPTAITRPRTIIKHEIKVLLELSGLPIFGSLSGSFGTERTASCGLDRQPGEPLFQTSDLSESRLQNESALALQECNDLVDPIVSA